MSDTRTERHLALLKYLPQEPDFITTPDLLKKLENDGFTFSLRTLQRDVEALSRHHALCCDDSVRPHRWYLLKGVKGDPLSMTPSTALAINMLREQSYYLLPRQVHDNLAGFFSQSMKKFEATPDNPLYQWPSRIAHLPTGFQLCQPEMNNTVIDVVEQALMHQKSLILDYLPRPPRHKKRYMVNPLGLVARGSVYYLVATLANSQEYRHFVLHRIQAAELGDADSKTPENFDLSSYIAQGSLSFPKQREIKLVLKVNYFSGYHLLETPISPQQEVTYPESEFFIINATVNYTEELKWWLMSISDISEVIAPDELRNELISSLKKALSHYP
ncbi:WYL domain-containing protein [Vibrio cholerae]|uniref:helix-turn-helix transcriptional regulator n=1 Tax=Vibrio cholerae TaxID=666 RepID=UPI00061620E6|nr:WYL domain-containing protein [Vibrio cholerae]AKB05548.1 WYL domain protein [Vibrio cholerae]EGQ7879812.1 WYL domain-containing protein [Vibrio cholerae]EGQ9321965.1 WYL domain-containing protein [Vibrio cholerae]EGQ9437207.1 WYL domain-containing protein [Vibrio cholerae]EGQ9634012.1 WYL domain-containing protein [Vibrio cholerae]